MSEEELKKKIEALERENQQLRAARKPAEYTVHEEEYKGHPLLVFEGPSLIRPLSLGIGKLKAIHACREQIAKFLVKHDSSNSAAPEAGDRKSDVPVRI